jgi:UDP-glucose 6-dehydrogenase
LGIPTFWEPDLEKSLKNALTLDLRATVQKDVIKSADAVNVIVGTPMDVHLNPDEVHLGTEIRYAPFG